MLMGKLLLFRFVLKKFLTFAEWGENNMATQAGGFAMIADAIAIVARSRRHLLQDAAGVAALFLMLLGTLHLAAV